MGTGLIHMHARRDGILFACSEAGRIAIPSTLPRPHITSLRTATHGQMVYVTQMQGVHANPCQPASAVSSRCAPPSAVVGVPRLQPPPSPTRLTKLRRYTGDEPRADGLWAVEPLASASARSSLALPLPLPTMCGSPQLSMGGVSGSKGSQSAREARRVLSEHGRVRQPSGELRSLLNSKQTTVDLLGAQLAQLLGTVVAPAPQADLEVRDLFMIMAWD